ncbi:hypothetical protein ABH975_004695 [Bradyrhizobium ottawaense]
MGRLRHAERQAELTAAPERRRAKHPVKPLAQKYSTFPNFGFVAYPRPSRPLPKGRFAIVTRCGPGGGGRGSAGAARHDDRAGNRESSGDAIRPGAVTAVSSMPEGEHTQAFRDFGGIVRGRRSRVVLTPGVCASRLAVMRRPNRARASIIRKATGAIVHRSPGRARRTPLKPSAQGRPGDRHTCGPPRVHLRRARTCGCRRRPAFPAPFGLQGARTTASLGRNAPREREGVSAPHTRCHRRQRHLERAATSYSVIASASASSALVPRTQRSAP